VSLSEKTVEEGEREEVGLPFERKEGQAELLEGRIDRGRINGKSRIGHCQRGRRGREEGRDSEREGKEDS
jgi:hypothetical protein